MNVMKLIGVSPHNWPSVYIVMPYMIYGSLLSYLRKNRADFTILNTNDDIDIVRVFYSAFLCNSQISGHTIVVSFTGERGW